MIVENCFLQSISNFHFGYSVEKLILIFQDSIVKKIVFNNF